MRTFGILLGIIGIVVAHYCLKDGGLPQACAAYCVVIIGATLIIVKDFKDVKRVSNKALLARFGFGAIVFAISILLLVGFFILQNEGKLLARQRQAHALKLVQTLPTAKCQCNMR